MLMMARHSGGAILIADNIEIKILEVSKYVVKMGITAPREIPVYRNEIFQRLKRKGISLKGLRNPNA